MRTNGSGGAEHGAGRIEARTFADLHGGVCPATPVEGFTALGLESRSPSGPNRAFIYLRLNRGRRLRALSSVQARPACG
jgi:hypothetical protein